MTDPGRKKEDDIPEEEMPDHKNDEAIGETPVPEEEEGVDDKDYANEEFEQGEPEEDIEKVETPRPRSSSLWNVSDIKEEPDDKNTEEVTPPKAPGKLGKP